MRDTIYRDEAIEAVCGVVIDEFDVSPTKGYEVSEHALSALPSAEAAQGWIPCSEGLPDVGERCLVALSNKVVAIGTLHSAGECVDDSGYIVRWGQRWHLEPSSIMIAYPKDSVVAWMPLPKPWEGGDTE